MAISFSFKPSGFNKVKKQTKTIKEKLYTIVEKNIVAVCFFDLEKLWYVIPINFVTLTLENCFYKFTNESYFIKSDKPKYSTCIINNKFISVNEINYVKRGDKKYNDNIYMPFMAGVLCKGNLIKNNVTGIILFDLKDTKTDWKHQACKDSIKDYIKNYELYKPIIERYKNGEI